MHYSEVFYFWIHFISTYLFAFVSAPITGIICHKLSLFRNFKDSSYQELREMRIEKQLITSPQETLARWFSVVASSGVRPQLWNRINATCTFATWNGHSASKPLLPSHTSPLLCQHWGFGLIWNVGGGRVGGDNENPPVPTSTLGLPAWLHTVHGRAYGASRRVWVHFSLHSHTQKEMRKVR